MLPRIGASGILPPGTGIAKPERECDFKRIELAGGLSAGLEAAPRQAR
jgi:hypothetical protein